MDAQKIREQLKPGEVVLVNGHFAVIEKIDENGITFITGPDAVITGKLHIETLYSIFKSEEKRNGQWMDRIIDEYYKGERDVRQDDSSQGHQSSDKDALDQ